MNDPYDAYKEEALRILYGPGLIRDNVSRFVVGLHFDNLVPGVILALSESHYQTGERMAVTVTGHLSVMEDRPWYGDSLTRRRRRQNRWLVRKLKDYGLVLGATSTQISTNHGTVYFTYHVVVGQESHIL